MAVKPFAKAWKIKEQIVEDASGLTLQFEVVEGTAGKFRLRVFGDNVPFGNREILFGANGAHVGGGTFTGSECLPGWLEPVDT
jgi:hypothetical protein